MQAKKLQKARTTTVRNAVAPGEPSEALPRRRTAAVKTAAELTSASVSKLGKVSVNGSVSLNNAKALNARRVKFSFSMPPAEHEAIVASKHKMSEVIGAKVKKSDIVRAGVLLLLSLPDAKLRAALGKISASNGSQHEN